MDAAAEARQLELCRRYLLPFVRYTMPRYRAWPVHKLIAAELEAFVAAVERRESPRLILELPPRVGKSELTSRRLPAWCLGQHPEWRFGLVAYGADLAERLSGDCRRIVMSDEYARVFGSTFVEEADQAVEIDKASKAVNYWRIKPTKDNPQPGGMLAVGVGGPMTGEGFDVLLFDDPIKNEKEARSRSVKDDLWRFFNGTLYDRLEPGAGVIIVQQRWAMDDLVGRLLDSQDSDEDEDDELLVDQWRVISLPAECDAPDDPLGRSLGEFMEGRYSVEEWKRRKANILKRDPAMWWAKFQQQPVPDEGLIFHTDLLVEEEEPFLPKAPVYHFWDTAYSLGKENDYSVCGVWRLEHNGFRLLHVLRDRLEFPDLVRRVKMLANLYPPQAVVVEAKASGQSLVQELQRSTRLPVRAWNPTPHGDKVERAHAIQELFRARRVKVPPKAAWLPALKRELQEFPQGRHDDQVDMVSMALISLRDAQAALARAKQNRLRMVDFEVLSA